MPKKYINQFASFLSRAFLLIILLIQQIVSSLGGMNVLPAYAETDSYGTTIEKTIVNETSTGVDFRIDWGSTGGILSGFVLEDNYSANLNFLSKDDTSITSVTDFSSGSNTLRWTFNENITLGTSGSIFLNFAKTTTGAFTNTGHLYGGEYTCETIDNENNVSADFEVSPNPYVAPSADLMIDKKEGNCVPTAGGIGGGGMGLGGAGMLSGFQSPFTWNCTDIQPLSRYSLGDDVYYTLYVHNFGPNPLTNLAVADRFNNNALQLLSVSGTYFGSRSHIIGSDLIAWTDGFALGVNRGAYITLRFRVIADEYSPIDNIAKTFVMDGDPSQYIWNEINNNFDSLVYPNDTNASNNSDSVQITIRGYDLAINKSLIAGTESAGSTVTYRLSFSNSGVARTDIMLRDVFTFSGVKIQSWAGSPGLVVDTPPVFTPGDFFGTQYWQGIHLGSNATGYIDITVQLPNLVLYCVNPPTFRNNAAIGTDKGIPGENPGVYLNRNDINITNNNDSLTINTLPITIGTGCGNIIAPYDLRINKTADKTVVTEGDIVTYTLNVYNSGQTDKFVYLEDVFTQGMIFDHIVIDPTRYIKWRDNNNLRSDVITHITHPNNSTYRIAGSYTKLLGLLSSSFTFVGSQTDVYDIVSGNIAGLAACQTLFNTGSMYQTNFAGIMSRYAMRDNIYATHIGLGMSVPEAIATTMADVHQNIWTYIQNQIASNARDASVIASQASSCGYYIGYEYTLGLGYSPSEAQDWGDLVADDMSATMQNIYAIMDNNYISILNNRLEVAGYTHHLPFSDLLPLYTNSGQVWDEIYNLYIYPEDTYVDLWQGNNNLRGPTYVVSGTDYGSTDYYFNNVSYDDFADFISSSHGSGQYTIPLYIATANIDSIHDALYFQTGVQKTAFYIPANQNVQFEYTMIVGNGYNSGDIIPNSATIAMCQDTYCVPGTFVYSSEIIPGANNTSNFNLTYVESSFHYDLSGTNTANFINPVVVGSPVSYDINYCNNGPDAISGATITYNYDSRLTFVSSIGGSIGSPTNDATNHLLNRPGTRTLALNECENLTLNFVVNSLANSQNNITNILHVGRELGIGLGYAGDTNITNNHVVEDFLLSNAPLYGTSSKVIDGREPYYVGDPITFTINFSGHGDPTTIIDNFDNSALQFVSATNGGVLVGSPGNYSVQWTNIDGTSINSVDVSFTIIGAVGSYTNNAIISSEMQGACSYETLSDVSSSVSGTGVSNFCGDGVVAEAEQCDLGTGNGVDSSCSLTCTLNAPSCIGVNFSPTAGNPGTTVTGTLPYHTGFIYNNLNWGEGSPVLSPLDGATYTYNNIGIFPISVQVSNILSGEVSTTCTGEVQITNSPINGVCGADNGGIFYTGSYPTLLCNSPTTPVAAYNPTTHSYVWSCVGSNGGSTASCQATESYCGDGIIGTGIGYTNQEQCDEGAGNGVNGTCSATCQWVIPSCPINLAFSPSNGVAPLTVSGTWTLATGTIATQLTWNTGVVINNPISGISHIYTNSGIYNPVLIVANTANTGIVNTCTGTVTVTNVAQPGVCGSKYNGRTVYNLTAGSNGLCPVGQTVNNFLFTTGVGGGGTYTWNCSAAGGDSPQCSATVNNPNGNPFNLSINKHTISTGPYLSGSTATYQIDFYNDSLSDQTDVNITDILPAGQQLITGSLVYYDSGFVTEIQTGSSPLERNIDILYTHQSGWIQYSTTVGSITGTQVNTVTILPFTGEETIPYTGGTCFTGHNPMSGSDYAVANTDNVDCEEIVVESPNPGTYDLALQKLYSSGNLVPGGRVRFVINVINQGNVTANNITITDTYPSGLTLNSAMSSVPWISSLGATSYTLPTLGSGQSTGLEIVFDIASNVTPGSILTNWAEISSDDGNDIDSTPDTSTGNDTYSGDNNISGNGTGGQDEDDHDPENITIPNPGGGTTYTPNLVLIKTGSLVTYQSGNIINYTIDVTNIGNTGQNNVVITERLPVGLYGYSYSFAGPGPVSTGAATATGFTVTIGTIYPGQHYTLLVSGMLIGTSTQLNTASITSGTCTTCTGTWTSDPYGSPLLRISKIGDRILYQSGNIINYTIALYNAGNTGAYNTVVTESYPTGFSYAGSSTTNGTYNASSREWTLPYIAAGTTGYLYLSGTLAGIDRKENTAMVTSGVCTVCSGTRPTDPQLPGYDLALIKTLVGVVRAFSVGQQVRFNIQITNQSSAMTAHNFIISDIIPLGLTLNDPTWILSGGRAWSVFSGTLAPGASTGKTITFTVNGSILGTIINRAQISSDDGDDIDSIPNNWTGIDVEDDDDDDYITVVQGGGGGGGSTYTPIPLPEPECRGSSCYTPPVTPPTTVTTVIKKILKNIRDVVVPQVKYLPPVKIPRTGADIEDFK